MQYSAAAVLALAAASASAGAVNGTGAVVYTTSVYTAYTTVCPASTQLTFNGVTYTASSATTLTITNCPCTVVKPVSTAAVAPSSALYVNGTTAATTAVSTPAKTTSAAVGTTSGKASPSASSTAPITASGGNKAFAFSGASLAGLLGLAAYIL